MKKLILFICSSFSISFSAHALNGSIGHVPGVGEIVLPPSINTSIGTLISPTVVLTVAHGLTNPVTDKGFYNGPIKGWFVLKNAKGEEQTFTVIQAISFYGGTSATDVGLAILETPVPSEFATPLPYATVAPTKSAATMTSVGSRCKMTQGKYDLERDRENRITKFTYSDAINKRVQNIHCSGDSGGPLLDENNTVVALTATIMCANYDKKNETCHSPSWTTGFAQVHNFASRIQNEIDKDKRDIPRRQDLVTKRNQFNILFNESRYVFTQPVEPNAGFVKKDFALIAAPQDTSGLKDLAYKGDNFYLLGSAIVDGERFYAMRAEHAGNRGGGILGVEGGDAVGWVSERNFNANFQFETKDKMREFLVTLSKDHITGILERKKYLESLNQPIKAEDVEWFAKPTLGRLMFQAYLSTAREIAAGEKPTYVNVGFVPYIVALGKSKDGKSILVREVMHLYKGKTVVVVGWINFGRGEFKEVDSNDEEFAKKQFDFYLKRDRRPVFQHLIDMGLDTNPRVQTCEKCRYYYDN